MQKSQCSHCFKLSMDYKACKVIFTQAGMVNYDIIECDKALAFLEFMKIQ